MKYLCLVVFPILFGCKNATVPVSVESSHLSNAETKIKDMLDSFKIEYSGKNDLQSKNAVTKKYQLKLDNYFMNHAIDSIKVHVDKVEVVDSVITTEFHHDKTLAFKYSLKFVNDDTARKGWNDSLFLFMQGLRVGSDTVTNFAYTLAFDLNNPNDSTLPTLRIFAFPFPTFLAKKH